MDLRAKSIIFTNTLYFFDNTSADYLQSCRQCVVTDFYSFVIQNQDTLQY